MSASKAQRVSLTDIELIFRELGAAILQLRNTE